MQMTNQKWNTRIFIIIAIFSALPYLIEAQSSWEPLIIDQQQFQKRAMMVLGGWGMVNVVSGGIGMATTEGATKYFHQMNLGWGAINTGLAITGYLGARSFDLDAPLGMSLLDKNLGMGKAFLFNTGLDVGYVMGGLYLRERARRSENPDRLRGFGNSIMLQGSFLFGFDLIAYFVNNSKTERIKDMIIAVGSTSDGVGLSIQF